MNTYLLDLSAPAPAQPGDPLLEHVARVLAYIEATSDDFRALLPEHPVLPIPFVGHPATAKVITVGLNPSHGEFKAARGWRAPLTAEALTARCKSYFDPDRQAAPPHPWFAFWSEALTHIGASYANGSAVHIDLTPRPTRFVRKIQEAGQDKLFREMLQQDLWCFFAALDFCKNVKVLLLAGSATGKYYANQFLHEFAPDHGYTLTPGFVPKDQPGPAKTACHTLKGHGREILVFFCSTSPSDRNNGHLLPNRIAANADKLKAHLT